ncbi:transglycosylase SLT domain-containing protein [Ruegeria sp. 2205SS24-7]|uniref:transglycosylase SLT domain-containing protein n=1 Tax=Ruegeria discodermiae TaxID=3064389 RepID=UPI0027423AD0|nr:transglycosylase SLT domain-containing protein [Ruegeria sp. 2205SS24-7]MDP5220017.1 transglycosylase SLT domain-containing protein [Ruegeria sp. 2205SS24-7]
MSIDTKPAASGLLLFVFVLGLYATPATALRPGQFAAQCDRAAIGAAQRYGVPESVMLAITRVETGRTRDGALAPWPWAINISGKGYWFQTRHEAQSFVFKHFVNGARNFDVGCFQINYRWHGNKFRSIEEMFDPQKNADHAARFLLDLHREFRNWTAAAGAYHSRTQWRAEQYAARFREVEAKLPDGSAKDRQHMASKRSIQAALPLTQGTSPQLGSLVPTGVGTGASFLALN